MAMLLTMLDAIESGADLPADAEDEAAVTAYFTRLATAIAVLIAKDPSPIKPQVADLLAFHNRHIAAIFRLSGYADPGHLYRVVQAALKDRSDEASIARYLSAASIAAPTSVNWPDLLERVPAASSSAYLAQFSHRAPLGQAADEYRNRQIALAPKLNGRVLRDSQLALLCQSWMLCSYLTSPDRHELKRSFNGLIAGWIERSGLPPDAVAPEPPVAEPPVLVVVADVMLSWHAMFKTYANFLRQLRARFRLVLVCLRDRADEAALDLFDEVCEIADPPNSFADAVSKIREIGPAVLYFPSVGMSVLTVQLCNLRLAPVQVASVGHPATTHSPFMDYIVMGHTYYDDTADYSERVLLLQSTGALFEPTLGSTPPEPNVRETANPVRVAISSSSLKLNARFLNLCRTVAQDANRRVTYHVFPNEQGIRQRDCAHQIRSVLPDAVVHPRVDYDDYLVLLNDCDIRFGTFPFGGANTTMYVCLLGIPTVTMIGPEAHSRTDARFVTLFDLPDWLVAGDEEAYRRAALRLIDDDSVRIALSRQILDADPAEVMFKREQALYPTDFANTLWWAYSHHATIQESPRRAWRHEDRVALAEDKL